MSGCREPDKNKDPWLRIGRFHRPRTRRESYNAKKMFESPRTNVFHESGNKLRAGSGGHVAWLAAHQPWRQLDWCRSLLLAAFKDLLWAP